MQPDFNRFRSAVLSQGEPDRVPLAEASIDTGIAEIFSEIAAALCPGMRIVAYQGHIFTPAWQLMGFESFCFALQDDPALVEALFERVGSIQYAILERVTSFPQVAAAWWPDDIAYTEGLMVAPQHLRHYLFPWLWRMGEACADRDIPWIYHSDGDLTEVIEDLIECGFHAPHPIEPKAMDIVALKRRYAGRLALMGNLDLAYALSLGTPEEVAAEVRRLLREVAPGGGFCLGSGNSVPEYVPLANYQAMRETALEYGGYPTRV
jgi:uroporphyrinogen decarboxylase